MTSAVCVTTGVTKQFRARGSEGNAITAVRDVSLTIRPGEIVALLGPNGAGKTSLLDMLLGLTQPSSGRIDMFGTTPRTAIVRGHVGAVLQTGGLLPDVTVRDTVRMVAATLPNPAPVDRVLADTNLTHLARRRVKRCSGGEQQRLRHALALLSGPDLLVLDEPTAGMDPNARRDFWTSMREQTARGTTVVFATHYLEEAQHFAERIVLMHRGSVVADGAVAAVQRQVASTRVSARLGSDFDPARLPVPVTDTERHGEVTVFVTAESDALARYLLTETDARDLTITTASLDDVFAELTSAPIDRAAAPIDRAAAPIDRAASPR